MNIVEFSKQPSQTAIIANMSIGQEMLVDYSKANSLRTIISRDIKDNYPLLEFETKKVEIKKGKKTIKYIKIKRTA